MVTKNFGLTNANYGEFRYETTSVLQRVPYPQLRCYNGYHIHNFGVTTGTISSLISLQVFCGTNISRSILLLHHQVLDKRLIRMYKVPGLCLVQRLPVFIFLCLCKKIPGQSLPTDRHLFLPYHYTLTIHRPTSISCAATLPQQLHS